MPLSPQLLAEYNAARRGQAWFDLSDRDKVQITGADRAAFLHNFCTNDIKNLPVGRGCEAFLCNGKGKILAYVRVFAFSNALWLDAAPGLGPKIVQHLDKYLITEDVTIADRTSELCHILQPGPGDAHKSAAAESGILQDFECELGEFPGLGKGLVWRADVLKLRCFHYLVDREKRDAAQFGWGWYTGEFASRACYEILRVEAGMPEYGQDIDESNYPQEVGRDAQAISFTKGCYLGQEPIVMIRDRGQVSRLLVGLKLPGDEPAAPGTQLTHEGKEIGKITSSVWSPLVGGPIALGYVRRGLTEAGTKVQVAGSGDATITKLPFAAA